MIEYSTAYLTVATKCQKNKWNCNREVHKAWNQVLPQVSPTVSVESFSLC